MSFLYFSFPLSTVTGNLHDTDGPALRRKQPRLQSHCMDKGCQGKWARSTFSLCQATENLSFIYHWSITQHHPNMVPGENGEQVLLSFLLENRVEGGKHPSKATFPFGGSCKVNWGRDTMRQDNFVSVHPDPRRSPLTSQQMPFVTTFSINLPAFTQGWAWGNFSVAFEKDVAILLMKPLVLCFQHCLHIYWTEVEDVLWHQAASRPLGSSGQGQPIRRKSASRL